jgi:hypothetical protein
MELPSPPSPLGPTSESPSQLDSPEVGYLKPLPRILPSGQGSSPLAFKHKRRIPQAVDTPAMVCFKLAFRSGFVTMAELWRLCSVAVFWRHAYSLSPVGGSFPLINDSMLREISRVASSLVQIDLSNFVNMYTSNRPACETKTGVTDMGIGFLAASSASLRRLNLGGRENVSDASLHCFATQCPALEHLTLTWCGVTDAGIAELARRCTGLRHLNLTWCQQVGNDGLVDLAANCPHLTHLNLSDAGDVTDQGVIALAQGCPQLEFLDLGGHTEVSVRGVGELVAGCPRLRRLRLDPCETVNNGKQLWKLAQLGGLEALEYSGVCEDGEWIAEVDVMKMVQVRRFMTRPKIAHGAQVGGASLTVLASCVLPGLHLLAAAAPQQLLRGQRPRRAQAFAVLPPP